jgi:parallel beta helix pectate lyase-like protein
MIYLFSIVLAVLWGWATPAAVGAAGTAYYVASTGSDGNPCSQAAPCRTIPKGVSKLRAGDILFIASGTYAGSMDLPASASGTSESQRTVVRLTPGARVTILGAMGFANGAQYITVDGSDGTLVVDGQQTQDLCVLCFDNPHHIRVKGVEFKGGTEHGVFGSGTHLELINLNVHDNGKNAAGVWCHNMSRGYCHGLYFASGADNSDNLIEGGSFHHNEAVALHMYGANNLTVRGVKVYANGGHGVWVIGGTNATIYNNLIYNNGSINDGAQGVGIFLGDSGAQVSNNTLYNNRVGILNLAQNQQYLNNIAYGNQDANLDGNGCVTCSANLCNSLGGGCTVQGNPQFVNAAAEDFHLQAGSPAINAGVAVSDVTTDVDQTPRPQGGRFDIGACEYTDSAPSPLSPPMNVRIAVQ